MSEDPQIHFLNLLKMIMLLEINFTNLFIYTTNLLKYTVCVRARGGKGKNHVMWYLQGN